MSSIAELAAKIEKSLNSEPKVVVKKKVVNRSAPTIRSTIMKVVTEGGEKEWEDGYGGCEWSDIVKAVRSVHGEQKNWLKVRNVLSKMGAFIFRDTRNLSVERYILIAKDYEKIWFAYHKDERLCEPDYLRNACFYASEYAREYMRVANIRRG